MDRRFREGTLNATKFSCPQSSLILLSLIQVNWLVIKPYQLSHRLQVGQVDDFFLWKCLAAVVIVTWCQACFDSGWWEMVVMASYWARRMSLQIFQVCRRWISTVRCRVLRKKPRCQRWHPLTSPLWSMGMWLDCNKFWHLRCEGSYVATPLVLTKQRFCWSQCSWDTLPRSVCKSCMSG